MTALFHLAGITLAVSTCFLLAELLPVEWLRERIERRGGWDAE